MDNKKSASPAPVEPIELVELLNGDSETKLFFESLAISYKKRYCDWIARAKQKQIRQLRAEKAFRLLKDRQKVLKVGSFMDDVGIIKRIDDIPELRYELISICESKSHKSVSKYSLLLAEHVLNFTNTPVDEAIQECFDINLKWQEGKATFHQARDVAGNMHKLARKEKNPISIKVLRIMAQVAVTPHVIRHALIASDYTITLINLMYPHDMDRVRDERNIQIAFMNSI